MVDVCKSVSFHYDCSYAALWLPQKGILPLRFACTLGKMTSAGE